VSELDVERLAQAIRTAELRSQMAAESMGALPAETGPMPDWYRAYAADVAREYAVGEGSPTGAGTMTECPLEGVHEHAFRGPHRFREWYP
jgi:hypothetical protein